jgi:CO/xanthine dehydrogenase FAD-binding subunit
MSAGRSRHEAVRLCPRRLDRHRHPRRRGAGARFIAGGTNLLDLMKLQVETPDTLVDISRLALTEIEEREDGGLTIGALVHQ